MQQLEIIDTIDECINSLDKVTKSKKAFREQVLEQNYVDTYDMLNITIPLDGEKENQWFCEVIGFAYSHIDNAGLEMSRDDFQAFWDKHIGMDSVEVFCEVYCSPAEYTATDIGCFKSADEDIEFSEWIYKDRNGQYVNFDNIPQWLETKAWEADQVKRNQI